MSRNLTEGIIWKQLLIFALPIFFSSIFQHVYSITDSAIVGHCLGTEAFAAISSAGYIVSIVITFLVGVSTGTGIVVSHFFGAKDINSICKAIKATLTLSIVAGTVLTLIGIYISPAIINLTKTPADVVPYSIPYIKIYFIGTIPMLIYNLGSGVLRACGDSKNPLFILILSSILNIFLDLAFVVLLQFGVAGAAWATVLSQGFSAALVLGLLIVKNPTLSVNFDKSIIDLPILWKILRVGIPIGFQSAIGILAHLIMNTKTNELGTAAIASVNAVGKINNLAWLSVTAIGIATVTFVGQNMGAQKMDRVKACITTSLWMSIVYSVFMSFIVYIFRFQLIGLFIIDPLTAEISISLLFLIAPFYFVFAAANTYISAITGMGNTFVPMLINMVSYCFLRVVIMLLVMPLWPDVCVVALCYPISWVVALAASYLYYFNQNSRLINPVNRLTAA